MVEIHKSRATIVTMGKPLLIAIILAALIFGGLLLWSHATTPAGQNLNFNFKTTPTPTPTQMNIKVSTNSAGQVQSAQEVIDYTKVPHVSSDSAVIKTAKGDIDIALYPHDAPKTVMNFASLSKAGFYNNLTFHRVETGFVIQGGDPNGNGTGGTSIFGPTFEDELNPQTDSYKAGYLEGVVAMANRGPNTNSSQFFIMLADNPNLPKNYTIFGKVTSGMDVVKQIAVGDKILKIEVQ